MQPSWGDTYAPVGKLTTFHYLISMAASHGLAFGHLDMVTASLNYEVDGLELYMEAAVGWDGGDHEVAAGTAVRLKKALYGLKQAPRLWYGDINDFLLSLGFTQSKADPNLYIFGDITSIPHTAPAVCRRYVHGVSKQRSCGSQGHQRPGTRSRAWAPRVNFLGLRPKPVAEAGLVSAGGRSSTWF